MRNPTKYEPLELWLRESDQNRVTLSFERIEEIIGARLPPSVIYPALWQGTTPGRPGGAIAAAGWRVEAIDHGRRWITVVRWSAPQAPRPRLEQWPIARLNASVVITRMTPGPRLVIERAEQLAWDFFTTDASSVGANAYDSLTGKGVPNRITDADITAINQTMRARSPHSAWAPLSSAGELPWLTAIPPEANLFAATEDEWGLLQPAVAAALGASIGPGRQASVATKVLHLKRPGLFPVLDSLVAEQLGGVGKPPIALLEWIRKVGRDNRDALQQIRGGLAEVGIERTEVRIWDALLWASHPTAGLAGKLSHWEHRFAPAAAET